MTTSIQERIRTAIEAEILSGTRPPGSPIDEKALATSFSASRTPVREALMLLGHSERQSRQYTWCGSASHQRTLSHRTGLLRALPR